MMNICSNHDCNEIQLVTSTETSLIYNPQIISNESFPTWHNISLLLDYEQELNIATSKEPEQLADSFAMNTWVYLSWTAVFTLMLLVAISGNLIVIWIVIAHRRMRSVTNYFLVNLSLADLLMSTLNTLFNFIYMVQNHWPFGEMYCTFNNFMATTTVSASVYTLTAITCDRYMAIVRPLKPRMSKRMALIAIAIVWTTSSLIGSPCLLYSSTHTLGNKGIPRIVCILIWPDGMPNISQMDFTYQVSIMVLTYFIPIILMIWCYYGMGRVLWGSKSIGEMSQRQADSIRSKRKVVKMFIFVMMVFTICWLPYNAYFIYTHYDRSILSTKWVQHMYLFFYWLAMSNAMVNPLIYYWMNARFRKYFKTAACGWRGYVIRKAMEFNRQPGNETPVLGRNTHSFSHSASDEIYNERLFNVGRWFGSRRHRSTLTSTVRTSTKHRQSTKTSQHPNHQQQQPADNGNVLHMTHSCKSLPSPRKSYHACNEPNVKVDMTYV